MVVFLSQSESFLFPDVLSTLVYPGSFGIYMGEITTVGHKKKAVYRRLDTWYTVCYILDD